jgi:hypothetical protein
MGFKKISLLYLIIAIVIIGFVSWPTIKKLRESNLPYGKNFNNVRDSLGIPKIGDDWTISESNEYYRFWIAPDTTETQKGAFHQIKSSSFSNNEITGEEDDFFYDTGDSLAFRLILRYQFKDTTWDCELVRYRKYKQPRTKFWPVTLAQADSVLTKWGLSI